jgi:hypothetical protein
LLKELLLMLACSALRCNLFIKSYQLPGAFRPVPPGARRVALASCTLAYKT